MLNRFRFENSLEFESGVYFFSVRLSLDEYPRS